MPSNKNKLGCKGKKKKGFRGIQKQFLKHCDQNAAEAQGGNARPTTSADSSEKNSSASSRKISELDKEIEVRSSFGDKVTTRQQVKDSELTRNSIIDLSLLQSAMNSSAICKSCTNPKSKLTLVVRDGKRSGLAEFISIVCSCCHKETKLVTSRRSEGKKLECFDINRRSVMACNSMKGGRESLAKFCSVMNESAPVTDKAYAKHLNIISDAAKAEATENMLQAAKRVRDIILERNPELASEDEDGAVPAAITIDGTWHKRGFSSKYGVVVAISVETGEVLDYEVLSLYCHECKMHEKESKDSESYKLWKKAHEDKCQLNYEGSSGSMEGAGAISIFKRSIHTRKLKYTTFVGDGDSDTFRVVKECIENIYGSRYKVEKEECIGHIQKRMGTALRKLIKDLRGKKLEDGKPVGGRGRLTDVKVNQFQRYYGRAIRANIGNVEKMRQAVLAILHHSVKPSDESTSLMQQHRYCPKGTSSWCKFWVDKAKTTSFYDESQRLPSSFFSALEPTFKRLSDTNLLKRCQLGLTQNQNESFNSTIWMRCPKENFCGLRRITLAVSEAVCIFNSGAGAQIALWASAGIRGSGRKSVDAVKRQNCRRIKSASRKVSEKYKFQRWQKSKSFLKQIEETRKHYASGGFDQAGKAFASTSGKRDFHEKGGQKKYKKARVEKADATESPGGTENVTNIEISIPQVISYIQPFKRQ